MSTTLSRCVRQPRGASAPFYWLRRCWSRACLLAPAAWLAALRIGTTCIAGTACIAGMSSEALAQPKAKAPAQPVLSRAQQADYAQLRTELESGVESRILAALERIATHAHPGFAPLLRAALERGGTEKVLLGAISASKQTRHVSLSEPLAVYVNHREPKLRRAAADALIASAGPSAVAALRRALRSEDPVVRSIAAAGLGELDDSSAVQDLFLALDRDVAEAAVSIGQLCDDEACIKLSNKLGRMPFELITAGLEQILFRTDARVRPPTKITVIKAIGGLQTREAGKFLKELRERWPAETDPTVTKALDDQLRVLGGR